MANGFESLRVLEISGAEAGALAAKWLGDLGAAVIRLEPPASGEKPTPKAADRALRDTGKRLRTLDPTTPAGHAEFLRWLDWAHVSIESASPGPLVPRPEPAARPDLIRVLISPFGLGGPLGHFRSNAFTDEAFAGHLALNGEPGRPPIARPGRLADHQAGMHALIGALAAWRIRDATGAGRTVSISHLEGLVSLHQHTITMFAHDRHVLGRSGNRQPGYWHPAGLYRCQDGHVALHVSGQAVRDRLLVVAGLEEALLDPRFADDLALARHKDEFDALLDPWLRERAVDDVVARLQAARVPAGRVLSAREVLKDPQLEARGSLVEVEGVRVLRAPFVVSDHPVSPTPARPLDDRDAPSRSSAARPDRRRPAHPDDDRAASPLAGVRVLDLGRVWAGPLAGRLLADLGADVVAVEAPDARGGRAVPEDLAAVTHLFPDGAAGDAPWNTVGSVNALARSKRSITLDLRRPEARAIFERLVGRADVLLENFQPDYLPRLGLDFAALGALNPRLVHASITGFGAGGPDARQLALGPIAEARSGIAHAMGEPGGPPCRSGLAWPDPLAALHAVAGILVALRDREAAIDPRARRVEVSLHESALALCGELLIAAEGGADAPGRRGARDPRHAPQGVYPCAGEDRWIALSVTTDGAWRSLCRTLALDPSLAALDRATRRERHDEIDAALARATRRHDRIALTHRLQRAGVLAAWLADARDLCENAQLADRGFWDDVAHPLAGTRREPGPVIRFDPSSPVRRRPAPLLGQHNAEVLRDWLGADDREIDELVTGGILVDTPPA